MVLTAHRDRPLTYHDLVALPDDGKRYELIGGELFEMPSPGFFHQFVLTTLLRVLADFVLPRELGVVVPAPLDVRLDPRNTVQPDIVFLSRARLHLLHQGAFNLIAGAPDLLIEILSPSNRGYDFTKKAALYATFGVREYWIVDLDAKSIFVQTLRHGLFEPLPSPDGLVHSEVLPGLVVDPRQLLAIPAWITAQTTDR